MIPTTALRIEPLPSGHGTGGGVPAAPAEAGAVTPAAQPVTAEVCPQVEGIIRARRFDDGIVMRAGQPRCRTTARRHRAARDQAARPANARAAAFTVQAGAARHRRHRNADAVARQDIDDAVALSREAQAGVRHYCATPNRANVSRGFPAPLVTPRTLHAACRRRTAAVTPARRSGACHGRG